MSHQKSLNPKNQIKKSDTNEHERSSLNDKTQVSLKQKSELVEDSHEATVVPYDENLLERARTQWQFGDWQSLAQLNRDTLQHNPNRAKLALLAAAGRFQTGNHIEAKEFIRLAKDWGVSRGLVSRIIIAGVHNSLGRAAAIAKQEKRAIKHFTSAITVGAPGSEANLLTQARVREQITQIGFSDARVRDAGLGISSICNLSSISIAEEVRKCMGSKDILMAIDEVIDLKKLSTQDMVLFYMEVSRQFAKQKDKLTALHFLQSARSLLPQNNENLRNDLIKSYLSIGYADLATEVAFDAVIQTSNLQLDEAERKAIKSSYTKDRQIIQSKSEHGHDLLLSYLGAHIKEILSASKEKPVLIEIGTTREDVTGQGSTRKIAEFCLRHDLQFITVDMDPHNSHMASKMFSELGTDFQAVTKKGEEYLSDYSGTFDFIFLDAYDFDHGGHSELRQSRYKKFLGGSIDEMKCHKMHFDCAKAILNKLSSNGFVCIDDTWLENGKWTAKGTTAMPFLLKNGFKLIEARNRAALLAREG